MSFTYFFLLLKVVSLRKIGNALLLKSTYFLSVLTKKSFYKGKPMSVSIEPTTSCNLHCPECPSGLRKFHRPTGLLKEETLRKILDELSDTLFYITFYFQGEPLLHPKFAEMVSQIKERNIFVATSTNAHYLDEKNSEKIIESGLDRLIVSLDGADSETYLRYRKGGNFDLVIKNLKQFVEIRKNMKSKTPLLDLQFIVFKHNQHQIKTIKELGKSIGVDRVQIKTAQVYEFKNGNELIPDSVKFSRYMPDGTGGYRLKSKLPNRCARMWNGCVISWDGNIVPCCFDKDADFNFGSINDSDYFSIANSRQYQNFRKGILENRKQYEICRNCTEGLF